LSPLVTFLQTGSELGVAQGDGLALISQSRLIFKELRSLRLSTLLWAKRFNLLAAPGPLN
jgi:hypothetical protein